MEIVLSSASPARKQLLSRLNLPFAVAVPDIDETPRPNESVTDMVLRLAVEKAQVNLPSHPHALIIGSDQVLCVDNQMMGKPGTHKQACEQLKSMSGQTVLSYTGLCLLNAQSGELQTHVALHKVYFKALTSEMIEKYLKIEQPYACAGSFREEGLGIALVERFEGDDPTALTGLPLIQLIAMLDKAGVSVV